jgi:hypothetical protein
MKTIISTLLNLRELVKPKPETQETPVSAIPQAKGEQMEFFLGFAPTVPTKKQRSRNVIAA